MRSVRLPVVVIAVALLVVAKRSLLGALDWDSSDDASGFRYQVTRQGNGMSAGESGASGDKWSSCRPDQLIYVYDLPPQFNVDLTTKECNLWWWAHPRNACVVYSGEHWGIGPPLRDKKFSALGTDEKLWADTGQHALEVMFHHYLEKLYPCRTLDPEAAAAFYVPLYAGNLWHAQTAHECGSNQTCCPTVPTLARLSSELDAALKRLPYIGRHEGRDHFVTMALSTYFGVKNSTCCDSGLLNTPYTRAMTILGTQPAEGHKDRQVNIPYPTAFHPVSLSDVTSHQSLITASDRPFFVSFAGSLNRTWGLNSGRDVRAALKEQCDLQPDTCHLLVCAKFECSIAENVELYLRSTFCLQPPGDSPTRRGVFDAIQAGCVPVLFMHETVSPYVEFLPELDKYSIFIPMDDVIRKGVNVIESLKKVSNGEIVAKRECMASILPRLVYRNVLRTLESEGGLEGPDIRAKLLAEWTGAYEVAVQAALAKMQHRVRKKDDQ